MPEELPSCCALPVCLLGRRPHVSRAMPRYTIRGHSRMAVPREYLERLGPAVFDYQSIVMHKENLDPRPVSLLREALTGASVGSSGYFCLGVTSSLSSRDILKAYWGYKAIVALIAVACRSEQGCVRACSVPFSFPARSERVSCDPTRSGGTPHLCTSSVLESK